MTSVRREGTVGVSPRQGGVKSPVNTPCEPTKRGSAVRVRSVIFSKSARCGTVSLLARNQVVPRSLALMGERVFLFYKNLFFADFSESRRKNESLQRASENLRAVGV